MKQIFLLILSCIPFLGFSQNLTPKIKNLSIEHDSTLQHIKLQFDLSDVENDSMHVYLRISDNSGNSYTVNTGNATGDIGFPVMAGNAKEIVWQYNSTLLQSNTVHIKLIVDDQQIPSVNDLLLKVDTLRMKKDMQFLEGTRHYIQGATHLAATKDTILTRFATLKLDTQSQAFSYNQYQAHNLIGNRFGLTEAHEVAILDGHFDCVSVSPGADDNGSAIIALLEAARILSPYDFKKTVRFIGFDLEELGLLGSKEYVNNHIPEYEEILGVLNMEMIGYYSERKHSQTLPTGFNILFPAAYNEIAADTFRGNFITNVSNANSSNLGILYESQATMYVPQLKVITVAVPGTGTMAPDLRRSDHAPFWDKSYPALMLTDGANFRNKNYHTAMDVSDSLSYAFMGNILKVCIATLINIAKPMHAGTLDTTYTLPFVIDHVSSKTKEDIQLRPNPANQNLSVQYPGLTGKASIRLIDSKGTIVYESIMTQGTHQIYTEIFPSGIYSLELQNSKEKLSKKVLIQH